MHVNITIVHVLLPRLEMEYCRLHVLGLQQAISGIPVSALLCILFCVCGDKQKAQLSQRDRATLRIMLFVK